MTHWNPLDWKHSRLAVALVLVMGAALVGALLGYHRGWSIISAEHLNPADPYIPVIYEKFTAAWAVGLSVPVALIIYLFEVLWRSRR
jgi:hypothetical protein